jgi:hypothetical protein
LLAWQTIDTPNNGLMQGVLIYSQARPNANFRLPLTLLPVVMLYVTMNTESIPPRFMRPRQYAKRCGINWRTAYRYITEGLWPAYKFQGVLLLDVDEIDAILKGLVRRAPVKLKRAKAAKA